MSRLGARLLLSLLMLCLPLQSFGIVLTRLAGAAHYHVAVEHGHEHEHDHDDHHHDTIERHHHDSDDGVVTVGDDAEPLVSGSKSVIASIHALDVEPMTGLAVASPVAAIVRAAPERRAAAFDSRVVGVLERPPR